MIVYIPGIFPASWLINKKGLRFSVLLGSFGTCIGSWVKCLSVSPDRFWVTMIGQTIVAVSQLFLLSLPPRVASVWFAPNEVSRATAVGVFGNQLGIALGFVIPPLLSRS
ncbi:feline leukemia virus subgroup C receptor-related protein 2-like protein [Leptotrombidium deliense]|uniref:Feline leukemia virus subgroup C receptor-related protein 2-like protein n=1 Tax=Leptotrombidium deliense TaxID=299467 RepID=A0A443Q957_9ACAR|nr:feline leukemia virus subgroup C receptor-related protein 2-like protein [Leptotrombidium deliense]